MDSKDMGVYVTYFDLVNLLIKIHIYIGSSRLPRIMELSKNQGITERIKKKSENH